MFIKILWALRTLMYAPFLGSFKFPSYIAKPIFIKGLSQIHISKRVRILPHSRIEVTNRDANIFFDENISIGQNFHITCASELIIGKNTTIAENVMITDIDHDYKEIGVHILDQNLIIRKTKIGPNCFIGFGAVIQAGTILGEQCIVGANSVVRGEYPPYSVIVGVPGRVIKTYNFKTKEWEKIKS